MILVRARRQTDVTCRLVNDPQQGYQVSLCHEPLCATAPPAYTLYLSLSALQCRALEQSIVAGLITPEYLLRKSSQPSGQPAYLRVPLPCSVQVVTLFQPSGSQSPGHYSAHLHRSLVNKPALATLTLFDNQNTVLSKSPIPAASSSARRQALLQNLHIHAASPDTITHQLLRKMDAATASVSASIQ